MDRIRCQTVAVKGIVTCMLILAQYPPALGKCALRRFELVLKRVQEVALPCACGVKTQHSGTVWA
jgi:hypothetical protein